MTLLHGVKLLLFSSDNDVMPSAFQSTEDQHILPFVLYGCETWSLALRKELNFQMFKNEVLRKHLDPR